MGEQKDFYEVAPLYWLPPKISLVQAFDALVLLTPNFKQPA